MLTVNIVPYCLFVLISGPGDLLLPHAIVNNNQLLAQLGMVVLLNSTVVLIDSTFEGYFLYCHYVELR